MTLTESELFAIDDTGPLPVVVEVDGIPASGLPAEVPAPRAVLVALRGGATDSAYFDGPGHTALAYHPGVLAFAEECAGARTTGEFSDPT